MITYDAEHRVIVMDLVDLEHCGFDYDEFYYEIETSGITDEDAAFPMALLVNFAGGHALRPDAPDVIVRRLDRYNTMFQAMLARLGID